MDNGLLLRRASFGKATERSVLILIVMDNGLLRSKVAPRRVQDAVLILIVMDNGLLLELKDEPAKK